MALVADLSDEAYERLHAGSLPRTPEQVAAWAADERMQARNGTFELIEPPPGWEERLMVRWRAEREAFRPSPTTKEPFALHSVFGFGVTNDRGLTTE